MKQNTFSDSWGEIHRLLYLLHCEESHTEKPLFLFSFYTILHNIHCIRFLIFNISCYCHKTVDYNVLDNTTIKKNVCLHLNVFFSPHLLGGGVDDRFFVRFQVHILEVSWKLSAMLGATQSLFVSDKCVFPNWFLSGSWRILVVAGWNWLQRGSCTENLPVIALLLLTISWVVKLISVTQSRNWSSESCSRLVGFVLHFSQFHYRWQFLSASCLQTNSCCPCKFHAAAEIW